MLCLGLKKELKEYLEFHTEDGIIRVMLNPAGQGYSRIRYVPLSIDAPDSVRIIRGREQ